MKCFIHLNNESVNYCNVCKRPICELCRKVEDGICPRCSNFTHKTIYEYNRKLLLFLLLISLARLTVFYDVVVLTISTKSLLPYTSTGVLLLIALFIPFVINIIRYGFKNAVKYQCFGKTSAIEIADNKKWKSPITYLLGILTLIICGVFYIIFTPLFIVTDIIHLIKSVKDFFYHKKRILTETKIKNLR